MQLTAAGALIRPGHGGRQAGAKVIEVLGPGCARCFETLRVVRHVVDEAHLVRTPAVAFDGTVVVSGRIPKAQEVRQLLGLA